MSSAWQAGKADQGHDRGNDASVRLADLEAHWGARWEFWNAGRDWYAVRRCETWCPEPEKHGSHHILWSATLEGVASRLREVEHGQSMSGGGGEAHSR